jgi:hypothetical protein
MLPAGATTGTEVHLKTRPTTPPTGSLDPAHPQALVCVVADGKAALGAVYRMPVAGRPGPEPGAAITRWHAHNISRASAIPPGIGLASPFGGCPAFPSALTMPEMMHVRTVVDHPVGRTPESVDLKWAYAYDGAARRPLESRVARHGAIARLGRPHRGRPMGVQRWAHHAGP